MSVSTSIDVCLHVFFGFVRSDHFDNYELAVKRTQPLASFAAQQDTPRAGKDTAGVFINITAPVLQIEFHDRHHCDARLHTNEYYAVEFEGPTPLRQGVAKQFELELWRPHPNSRGVRKQRDVLDVCVGVGNSATEKGGRGRVGRKLKGRKRGSWRGGKGEE